MEALKKQQIKIKNGENVPHLEITEVVLVNCKTVNNDYQHNSRVLRTFLPSKSFGQLLDILSKKIIFLKTFNLEMRFEPTTTQFVNKHATNQSTIKWKPVTINQ